MDVNKIPARSEIPEAYTWDLRDIFESDEAWEKALAAIPEMAKGVIAYQGRLKESPAVLRAFLDADEMLNRKIEDVYCYASLRYSEDTRAEAGQVMTSKAMGILTQVMAGMSFAQPEILSLSEEEFKRFMDSEELAPYRHTLEDLLRAKAHTLTEAEEKILSGMSEKIDAEHMDLGGIYRIEFIDELVRLCSAAVLDEKSLYTPIEGKKAFEPEAIAQEKERRRRSSRSFWRSPPSPPAISSAPP